MVWLDGSGRSAAWLARHVRVVEVAGSNPAAPTCWFTGKGGCCGLKARKCMWSGCISENEISVLSRGVFPKGDCGLFGKR